MSLKKLMHEWRAAAEGVDEEGLRAVMQALSDYIAEDHYTACSELLDVFDDEPDLFTRPNVATAMHRLLGKVATWCDHALATDGEQPVSPVRVTALRRRVLDARDLLAVHVPAENTSVFVDKDTVIAMLKAASFVNHDKAPKAKLIGALLAFAETAATFDAITPESHADLHLGYLAALQSMGDGSDDGTVEAWLMNVGHRAKRSSLELESTEFEADSRYIVEISHAAFGVAWDMINIVNATTAGSLGSAFASAKLYLNQAQSALAEFKAELIKRGIELDVPPANQ